MRIFLGVLGFLLTLTLTWLILPGSVKLSIVEQMSVQAFLDNSAAVVSFEKGDLGKAMSHWTNAVSVNPSEDKLHYNLGLGFQTMSRGDDASGSYGMVLKSPNATGLEKFASLYNMGTMAQKAKQVDEALKHYQAALDINPTSLETKINIELLISQGGGGGGEGKEKSEGGEQGKDPSESDPKDGENDKPPEYAPNKPQKPQFKSEELTPSDVNKILSELKQQEQRIRAEFSRKGAKESQGDKDW